MEEEGVHSDCWSHGGHRTYAFHGKVCGGDVAAASMHLAFNLITQLPHPRRGPQPSHPRSPVSNGGRHFLPFPRISPPVFGGEPRMPGLLSPLFLSFDGDEVSTVVESVTISKIARTYEISIRFFTDGVSVFFIIFFFFFCLGGEEFLTRGIPSDSKQFFFFFF